MTTPLVPDGIRMEAAESDAAVLTFTLALETTLSFITNLFEAVELLSCTVVETAG